MKKKQYFCDGCYTNEETYIVFRTRQLRRNVDDCKRKIEFCFAEIEEKRKWIKSFEREIKELELLGGRA